MNGRVVRGCWAMLLLCGLPTLLWAQRQPFVGPPAPPTDTGFVGPLLPPVASPPAPIDPAVLELVKQLGHRDYRQREAASKQLYAKGESALPSLRRAGLVSDPEVRRRLVGLVQELETTALLGARTVTYQAQRTPLHRVIADLNKLTGYRIELVNTGEDRTAKQAINLKWVNTPFWLAIEQLCAQAGLQIQQQDGGDRLQLTFSEHHSPFVFYSGAFRFQATNINFNKSINLAALPRTPNGDGPASENLALAFLVSAEPKLPLLTIGQPRVLSAIDDRGTAMPTDEQAVGIEANYFVDRGFRQLHMHSQVQVNWLNKQARKIASLKGKLPVVILAEQRPDVTIETPLKVKNKKYTGSNIEVEVEQVTEANKNVSAKLKVRRTGKDAQIQDYNWAHSLVQKFELYDAQGRKYESQGAAELNSASASNVDITLTFAPPEKADGGTEKIGSPVKLVYNLWILLNHEVDFEFKQIPLP
jgi:hypothetical protein